jgi:hypothetical protein
MSSYDEGPYEGFDIQFDEAKQALRLELSKSGIDWHAVFDSVGLDADRVGELLKPGANVCPEAVEVMNRLAQALGHASAFAIAQNPKSPHSKWDRLKLLVGVFIDKFAGSPGVDPSFDWMLIRAEFERYMSRFFGSEVPYRSNVRHRAVAPTSILEMAVWFDKFSKENPHLFQ